MEDRGKLVLMALIQRLWWTRAFGMVPYQIKFETEPTDGQTSIWQRLDLNTSWGRLIAPVTVKLVQELGLLAP